MKSLSLWTLGGAVVCLTTLAFAGNLGQLDVPINVTVTNPCNGEFVDLSGVLHLDATITVNGNTTHVTSQANAQGVTGIGEVTGDVYHGTGVTRADQNVRLVNGSANATFIDRFDIVGTGGVPGFSVHETTHITFDANRIMTVSFDNLSMTCH